MSKPQCITVNNENVYTADEIYKYDKAFFIGCSRVRLIIDKKGLKDEDYFFAYKKGDNWIRSTANYPRAKLFLREEYVVKNVPKMMDEVKQELYKYPEAPEILELEDTEKFKDKDGKIINIEVRGERKHDSCYFKVKDISNGFEMPNLNTTLLHKDRNDYQIDLHYKTFTIIKTGTQQSQVSKTCLYLTYNGILKVLFCSRTGNAESFQSWASEKLFTVQMGTEQQKDELASQLIGVNSQTIHNVFRANTAKTPCVYLYFIGNPSELLEGEYDKDDLLCKFGCTSDISRRNGEHEKTFKKEFNKNVEMLCFSIIDVQYIFDAEKNITQYFKSNLISYENSKEMIIINRRDLPQIKQHYRMIQNSYIGRYEELNNKVVSLEKEVLRLNNELIVKDKDIEIMIEKHKNEILRTKLEFFTSYFPSSKFCGGGDDGVIHTLV